MHRAQQYQQQRHQHAEGEAPARDVEEPDHVLSLPPVGGEVHRWKQLPGHQLVRQLIAYERGLHCSSPHFLLEKRGALAEVASRRDAGSQRVEAHQRERADHDSCAGRSVEPPSQQPGRHHQQNQAHQGKQS
jgi:hypothetical protein